MSFLIRLKSALLFARHQAWVNEPDWDAADAANLTAFLGTRTGARLRDTLVNLTLRQQAKALSSSSNLKFEAGYCSGQKGAIVVIQSLAEVKQFTESGEEDAHPTTN